MDRNTLIAIVLSIALLIAYQYFFIKPAPTPTNPPQAQETPKVAPQQEVKTPSPAPVQAPAVEPLGEEKEVRIENALYTAVLTSRGGTVKRIELKKYKDKKGAPIVLRGDTALPPFALILQDGQPLLANFNVKGADKALSAAENTAILVFEYTTPTYFIRRTYTFTNDSYAFNLKDEVQGISGYFITLGKDFGIVERVDSEHIGPVVLKDSDRNQYTANDLKEPKIFREGVRWVAQEDKYFFAALVPKEKIVSAQVLKRGNDAVVDLQMESGVSSYLAYAGPKERDRLKKLGVGLEHIVDFGFFSILAVPFFWILKHLYALLHNYGFAIIVLTLIVRIPFIPLINKGQKSMKRLQDIQPRMAEVREKYKNDPQKMQRELMALYKKHKVNPLGGCLPMLIQIPFFFALYKILSIAIELRNAPFMLWIQDLSSKDPYYVLPILMGVTMFIQQKMTPSTMDPKQQKIMLLMPVVFTFVFLSFPSGLVLYWLVTNVLSIAQQYFVNKKLAHSAS